MNDNKFHIQQKFFTALLAVQTVNTINQQFSTVHNSTACFHKKPNRMTIKTVDAFMKDS